ncbi:hypothetical protein AFLA_006115 [Aspergillus flavus NRRL3357]|nr:hypothetical protein AFLA_006115 [Aspergillus flavus NRRL3357]
MRDGVNSRRVGWVIIILCGSFLHVELSSDPPAFRRVVGILCPGNDLFLSPIEASNLMTGPRVSHSLAKNRRRSTRNKPAVTSSSLIKGGRPGWHQVVRKDYFIASGRFGGYELPKVPEGAIFANSTMPLLHCRPMGYEHNESSEELD